MLVLRIETLGGIGPYQTDDIRGMTPAMRAHKDGGCPQNQVNHPTPDFDLGLFAEWEDLHDDCHLSIALADARFGFEDATQYYDWFHTRAARQSLSDSGYHLTVYKAPRKSVIFGSHQIIYDGGTAERATRLETTIQIKQLEATLTDLRRADNTASY